MERCLNTTDRSNSFPEDPPFKSKSTGKITVISLCFGSQSRGHGNFS